MFDDLRFALGLILRQRALAAATTLTLSLAVGGVVALFSVVYGLLLRPPLVRDVDRVVIAYRTDASFPDLSGTISYPHFQQWTRSATAFDALAAMTHTTLDVAGDGTIARLDAAVVSRNFFDTLGVPAFRGRTFSDTDAAPVPCVLAYHVWRQRYASDPAVIGRTLRTDSTMFTIVGVMPPAFERWREQADVWVPIDAVPEYAKLRGSRGYLLYTVVGRLKAGAGVSAAATQLTAATRQMPAESRSKDRYGARVVPLREDVVKPQTRRLLTLMMVMVGLVWAIACANVGGMLLSRTTDRIPELAVRIALGASRFRLARQILVESAVVAVAGCAGGTLLAAGIVRIMVTYGPAAIARDDLIRIDGVTAVVAIALAVVTTVAVAFGSLLQVATSRIARLLQESRGRATATTRATRLHDGLVVVQLALAVVVLTGAGLIARSYRNLERVDLGFDPSSVLSLRLSVPAGSGPAGINSRYERLRESVRYIPGVSGAAFGADLPVPNRGARTSITIEGGKPYLNGNAEDRAWTPGHHPVSADYFRVLGVPLVRGRAFTAADDESAPPVAVITEEMARLHWPGVDPIGHRVTFGHRQPDGTVDEPWITIVGVARNVRFGGPEVAIKPEIFTPLAQWVGRDVYLITKSAVDPRAVADSIRQRINAVEPSAPVFDVQTMEQRLSTVTADARYRLAALSWFALLAAVLCAVGIHVAVATRFMRRRRELALRAALGATTADLLRFILRHAVYLVVPATAMGLAAAAGLGRVMASQLFQVSPGDAMTFVIVAVATPVGALLVATAPARRACRVDPAAALRAE